MKGNAVVIYICLAIFVLGPGCSDEEQPPYTQAKAEVRKPIILPEKKKSELSTPVPDVNPAVEIDSVKQKSPKTDTKATEEKSQNTEKENGVYLTREGDTLSAIAGNPDIYGDPLKWAVLYRVNRQEINNLSEKDIFPDDKLPGNIKLRIITPDQIEANLKDRTNHYWVVNIFSSPEKEIIETQAIMLINKGYPVYISRTDVKGKEWMRLRVGFFESRQEADEQRKKFISLLSIPDIWITRIGDEEFGEFGGY